MVLIFTNLCLWRRSLRSNLGGIEPEKLYRATLMYHDRTLSQWPMRLKAEWAIDSEAMRARGIIV